MSKTLELKLQVPAELVIDSILERIAREAAGGVSVSSGDIPKLGDPWPSEGGIRAAECRADDGRIYDLVVVTGPDGKPVIFKDRQWGGYGTEIEGCESLRDGLANTKAMVKAGNELAKEVSACQFRGLDDSYLPALCELNQVFANIGHLFETDVYWSSTQYSANYAWTQFFSSGHTHGWGKDGRTRAFGVRRVYR